jgi:hypothetical protein
VEARIGSLRSKAPVSLQDRARISGSVVSNGGITLGNDVVISGAKRPNVQVEGSTLGSFSVAFPAAGPAVSLEPDRSLKLSPGSYGAVSVKSRSSITLEPGNYFFTSLTLESDASLIVDAHAGTTRVYVKSALTFRGRIRDVASGPTKLMLFYFGESVAPVESAFDGLIVAPNGKLVLASTTHYGAFYAKELEVQAGAEIYPEVPRVSWYPVSGSH